MLVKMNLMLKPPEPFGPQHNFLEFIYQILTWVQTETYSDLMKIFWTKYTCKDDCFFYKSHFQILLSAILPHFVMLGSFPYTVVGPLRVNLSPIPDSTFKTHSTTNTGTLY